MGDVACTCEIQKELKYYSEVYAVLVDGRLIGIDGTLEGATRAAQVDAQVQLEWKYSGARSWNSILGDYEIVLWEIGS